MTDKKPKVNTLAYTELSIQIATLDMKLDAILKLLNKPEITIEPLHIKSLKDIRPEDIDKARLLFNDIVPPQWPNESCTDYLKRIGQYNEASSENRDAFAGSLGSDDEKFLEEFK